MSRPGIALRRPDDQLARSLGLDLRASEDGGVDVQAPLPGRSNHLRRACTAGTLIIAADYAAGLAATQASRPNGVVTADFDLHLLTRPDRAVALSPDRSFGPADAAPWPRSSSPTKGPAEWPPPAPYSGSRPGNRTARFPRLLVWAVLKGPVISDPRSRQEAAARSWAWPP